ncbi:DM13 domain-containing protein [Thalassotalea agariperforans]
MNKKLAAITLISLGLFACGGSGGSNSETPTPTPTPTPTTYTGIFVDSPVQGLKYQTATQAGTTNAMGEFIYQLGEKVTFSIGGITFPEVDVKAIITPLDIFQTENLEHSGVINMLRLLQTLDVDGNAENGIELSSLIHTLAANLTIDFTSQTFEEQIAEFVIDNNAINISLISAQQALAHFRETLMISEPSSCGDDHAKVGFTGSFNTLAHNVSGTAEIIDNCTIKINNFTFDGDGLSVFFYGGINSDFENGFAIGSDLLGQVFSNETVTIKLPNNYSLDDLTDLSVWCVPVKVNFGSLTFTAP